MVLLAKITYNTLLLMVLGVLALLTFGLVAGNPVKDYPLFILTLILGSIGFSIAFTFIAAIASGASNSATLMAILSFPVVLPILLTLVRLSTISLRLIQDTAYWRDVVNLLAIDAILITLTFVLFPYVWRD
jgi:heme exporter protein B